MRAMAAFQEWTAHGKLKAEMTPTIPYGFQTSIIKWPGLSDGITFPDMHLE